MLSVVSAFHSLTSKTNSSQHLSQAVILHKYIEQASTVEVATYCQPKERKQHTHPTKKCIWVYKARIRTWGDFQSGFLWLSPVTLAQPWKEIYQNTFQLISVQINLQGRERRLFQTTRFTVQKLWLWNLEENSLFKVSSRKICLGVGEGKDGAMAE